ncbi:ATP-binding protein [Staphylococcus hominis]|uniref:ATP-binding protein n=1 Tax=Staphylococcus hominis TaxID=1290 RepID=UPI0011A64FBF|nr:ATP-binding protein [Staphylococcus hominis]
MKKKNILNLIKYHFERNNTQFRNESIEIARYFDNIGDYQLSEYIVELVSNSNSFIPQGEELENEFLKKVNPNTTPLPLPKTIMEDVKGIINAVNHNIGINKFLLEGAPGTGKTETVKQISRLLDRELYSVEFSELIDSKLGQTAKNIVSVFNEINHSNNPSKILVLFDEIDVIAMDRVNSNDLREMGRVTSTILKEIDKLNNEVVLIATTNLFEKFDKALIRRFDTVINFNRYTQEDLIEVAEGILNSYMKDFKVGRDMKLFKKIINNMNKIPYPGELKNIIKISLAFSDPSNEFDYLRRLLKYSIEDIDNLDLKSLYRKNFTIRELEKLSGISKSQISRELKEG